MLSCRRVQHTGKVLCHSTQILCTQSWNELSDFTCCTATYSVPVSSDEVWVISCYVQSCADQIFTGRSLVWYSWKGRVLLSVNNSDSASQGMNLSLCPFLPLKSPMGPWGCGKWEARSLLNSCVIEFPHNTTNACMDAGMSSAQSTVG